MSKQPNRMPTMLGQRPDSTGMKFAHERNNGKIHRMRYGAGGLEMSISTGYGFGSVQSLEKSGISCAVSGSADYHARDYMEKIRAESRRFYRDNGIYKASINRIIDCILGDGAALQVKVKGKRLRQLLQDRWRRHWVDGKPEVRGMEHGPAVERMALTHLFLDGDVGAKKIRRGPKSGKIQLVEADQIGTWQTRNQKTEATIEQGIELDYEGAPLGYWVSAYDENGLASPAKARRISAQNFLFLSSRELASQTRGLPIQQVNFPMFHRLNDVCDSEAIAWQLLSRFAVIVNRADAAALGEETSKPYESPSDQDMAKRYHDVGDAVMFHANPGEEVRGVERNIPGMNFVESVKMFMRLLGLPFGLSLEFMLLIWTDTNYSSGRASKIQVERACGQWVRKLFDNFLTPIWLWSVRRGITDGEIPAGHADIFDHEFHVPPYAMLDEQKDEQARALRYENGSTSASRESKREGKDLASLLAEQEADLDAIGTMVDRLNGKYPWMNLTLGDVSGFGKQVSTTRKM